MAANFSNRAFNFESQTELAERKKVWNNNEVEIRFLFECDWIKEVDWPVEDPTMAWGTGLW